MILFFVLQTPPYFYNLFDNLPNYRHGSEKPSKRTSFMDELFGKTNKKESVSSKFLVDEKYKGFPETKPSDKDHSTTDGKESGSSSSVIGGVRPRRRGNALLGDSTSSDRITKSSSVVDDLLNRFAKTPIHNQTPQAGHEEMQEHVLASKVSSKTLIRKNEGDEIQITDNIVGSSPSGKNASPYTTVNSANFQQPPATTLTYGEANMFSMNNEKLIHEQSLQMDEFESQQQQKFQQDLEEQRRILEKKQNEYKVSYLCITM